MSNNGHLLVCIDRKGSAYSYASVADTFFWGERRKYLPWFQTAQGKAGEAVDEAAKVGLHLVRSSQPAGD